MIGTNGHPNGNGHPRARLGLFPRARRIASGLLGWLGLSDRSPASGVNGHAEKHAPSPRVFLGMPGYGEMTAGAACGLFRATRLPDAQVRHAYREGSLLAANFNGLWCDVLNLCCAGWRVDYFAMIHADVEPCSWWLDTLIAELEARDLDVLGVVVPIKDPHGLTSIALDRSDGDAWRPHARLTLREVYRLPETFTSDDVGRPILLNTGLWVCRFDPAWASKVHFEINDRIVVLPDGRYEPQCEPEDWHFSRQLHEIGAPGSPTAGLRPLRIGATRKVRLTHRGPTQFPNDHPWGEPFDAAWIDKSPLCLDGPALPDVDGWLLYEEGAALAELARGKRVLEIGSYCGLSTICMARTAEHVVAVDTFDGRGTPQQKPTREQFWENLGRYEVNRKVTAWVGTTASQLPGRSDRFDLVFIDGSHDRASVESDIAHALPLLAEGGLLAFHDYHSAIDPDVTAAVDRLVEGGATIVNIVGSLAVVTPPAHVPQHLEV